MAHVLCGCGAADDLDPLSPEFQLIKAKSQIESLEHQLSTFVGLRDRSRCFGRTHGLWSLRSQCCARMPLHAPSRRGMRRSVKMST